MEVDQENKIQRRECRVYGHIQVECANTYKKKGKKAYVSTLSYSEGDQSDEDKDHNDFIALTAIIDSAYADVT